LDPTLPRKNRDLRQYSSTPILMIYTPLNNYTDLHKYNKNLREVCRI